MTPEQEIKKQAEEVEKKAKEQIDSSVRIGLTKKQTDILNKITADKNRIQAEFAKLAEKETEIITFMLEFMHINQEQVQELKFSELGDAIIVVMKPEEKKEEVKADMSVSVNGKEVIDKLPLDKEQTKEILGTLVKEITKEKK